jgi:hypothetical protein
MAVGSRVEKWEMGWEPKLFAHSWMVSLADQSNGIIKTLVAPKSALIFLCSSSVLAEIPLSFQGSSGG